MADTQVIDERDQRSTAHRAALASLIRPWTRCDDGGRFDHGSDRAAEAVYAAGWRPTTEPDTVPDTLPNTVLDDEPSEPVIERADGLGRTEPYADPEITPDLDEDGEPVPGTLVAGWDISFGCRINFGPDPDGALRASVHVSDQARRSGLALTPTTPEQLRALAAHLTAVADQCEAGSDE